MIVRYDDDDKVLRSTGDPPNGILVVTYAIDASGFAVSASFEPSSMARPAPGRAVLQETMREGTPDESDDVQPVDTADVLDACVSGQELRICWIMAVTTWLQTAQNEAPQGNVELIADGLRFLTDVRDGVARR